MEAEDKLRWVETKNGINLVQSIYRVLRPGPTIFFYMQMFGSRENYASLRRRRLHEGRL